MKRIIAFAIAIASTLLSFAQTPEVGQLSIRPEVGMSVASFDKDTKLPISSLSIESKERFGIAAGFEADYQIDERFNISAGAIYTQQGSKVKYGNEDSKRTYAFDYITVPIMGSFYVANGLAVKIGIQPAFCVNDKSERGNVTDYAGNRINKFDLQLPIGASYEYKNFIIDARVSYGLLKVNNGYNMIQGENSYNKTLSVTLGYKFALGKLKK